MPKQKITKKMVVDAAFEIARTHGMEQVLVKNVARRLGCSVQPIYSYCGSMEGLRQEVVEETGRFIKEYTAARIDRQDLFRSTGNAYVKLAEEEPHLFRIFILHDRKGISSLDDLYRTEADQRTPKFIAEQLDISEAQAKELHLNMLIYTIGIGAILSVTTPGISACELFERQETAYRAFLNEVKKNGRQD